METTIAILIVIFISINSESKKLECTENHLKLHKMESTQYSQCKDCEEINKTIECK